MARVRERLGRIRATCTRRYLTSGVLTKSLYVAVIATVASCLLWAGVGSGNKTVTTAGTRVALAASSTPVVWATVQAKCANTGYIYVGGANVSSSNGIEIAACQAAVFGTVIDGRAYYDLAEIYIDASVNGEGVKFTYATRP